MLTLSLLLACRPPAGEPMSLALPGEILREDLTVTDDGRVLVLERPPQPLSDAIYLLLVAVILLLAPVTTVQLLDDSVLAAIIVGAMLAGCGGAMLWAGVQIDQLTVHRPDQTISFRYRWTFFPEVRQVTLPISDIVRIGTGLQYSEGPQLLSLELFTADDTRYRLVVGDSSDDSAIPFALGLCAHVAGRLDAPLVSPLRRHWL